MNAQVRALLRFWWVLVIGLAVAQVAAIMSTYRVDLSSMPPSLTQREQPRYSAEGRLLVTDGNAPHLRRAITETVQPPTSGDGESRPVEVTQPPDTAPILAAANLYPLLIESDQVREVRDKMFGPMTGALRAQAIYAISTPSRFTTSDVPAIQVIGIDDSPRKAVDLVNKTTTAFIRWMTSQQDTFGIKPKQRITVLPIQAPTEATAFGGSSSVLPVLVFAVVMMAFAAIALFLDRLFPRRRESVVVHAREARPEPARTGV